MAVPKEAEYYTYQDFLEWDDDVRAELFDGEIIMMASPSRKHQGVITQLIFQIEGFLKGKPCKVYPAPFAVRLFPQKNNRDDTVFEPDLTVVCDPEKLDDRGCNGAPDLIIEVTSPSSAKYDRLWKFRKYQIAGVREYWIVDPETKTVQACILENGHYVVFAYDETDQAPVTVLKDCSINLSTVFAE